jgi:hypothetical protein
MRRGQRRVLIAVLVMVGLTLAACGGSSKKSASTQPSNKPAQATLTVEQDRVDYRASGGDWVQVTGPQIVKNGDSIRTDANGKALLTFFTGTEVEILSSAELEVTSFEETPDGGHVITLNQLGGETEHRVARIVDSQSSYEINTPSATLTVRGTAFGVQVAPDGATHVEVTEGVVQAQVGTQTVDVSAGKALDITANKTIPSTPYPIPAILPPAATPRPTPAATETPTEAPTAAPTEAPTPTAAQRSK